MDPVDGINKVGRNSKKAMETQKGNFSQRHKMGKVMEQKSTQGMANPYQIALLCGEFNQMIIRALIVSIIVLVVTAACFISGTIIGHVIFVN